MVTLPQHLNFTTLEAVTKVWSNDKKYYAEAATGERYLLRLADISYLEQKQAEFSYMQQAANLPIPMSKPIDFGVCKDGRNVYSLFRWVDGADAIEAVPALEKKEQYKLGFEAGQFLQKIHTIPAPEGLKPWEQRFTRKINIKIEKYRECGVKIKDEEKIISYIEENSYLLAGRLQSFQHGDYHLGNMILSSEGKLVIIDFNRFDFGDPWEEFNRIVWCAMTSPHFASGRIDGYFNSKPPLEFFKLLAVYMATDTLSSIYWAIPFGEKEVETMINKAESVVSWYEGMTKPIPSWYREQLS